MSENSGAGATTLQAVVDGKSPVPTVVSRSNDGGSAAKARSASGARTAKRGAGGRFTRSAAGESTVSDGKTTAEPGPSHGGSHRKIMVGLGVAAAVLGVLWWIGRSKRTARDRATVRPTVNATPAYRDSRTEENGDTVGGNFT
jgi:hypothetical protein